MSDLNLPLQALQQGLAGALPGRTVKRGLIDPASADRDDLLAGVVCLVTVGGGDFANYLGREGELGTLNVTVVGFLLVEEDSAPEAIEVAELALLADLLAWTKYPGAGGAAVYPKSFRVSQQMEHPYGWLSLELDVKQ